MTKENYFITHIFLPLTLKEKQNTHTTYLQKKKKKHLYAPLFVAYIAETLLALLDSNGHRKKKCKAILIKWKRCCCTLCGTAAQTDIFFSCYILYDVAAMNWGDKINEQKPTILLLYSSTKAPKDTY
jgi:hypothetical protein